MLSRTSRRPYRNATILALLALFALLGTKSNASVSESTCAAPDTLEVPYLTRYLIDFVTSDEPVYKDVRDSIGLPRASTGHVTLEQRVRICDKAVEALNRILKTPGRRRHLWVFNIGVGYVIRDPDYPPVPGQSDPTFIFDRRWKYKGELLEQ